MHQLQLQKWRPNYQRLSFYTEIDFMWIDCSYLTMKSVFDGIINMGQWIIL